MRIAAIVNFATSSPIGWRSCVRSARVDVKGALTMPWLVAFVPRVRRRPHWQYRVVRTVDPVHKSPFGLWVLSRHQDVVAALRSPHMGSNEDEADMSALTPGPLKPFIKRQSQARIEGRFIEFLDQTMLFRDPPDHTRLRALVSKAFTPKRVEALSGRILELVDELLEAPTERGHIELMHEFAYPLPARVICELLGVPKDDEQFIVAL